MYLIGFLKKYFMKYRLHLRFYDNYNSELEIKVKSHFFIGNLKAKPKIVK